MDLEQQEFFGLDSNPFEPYFGPFIETAGYRLVEKEVGRLSDPKQKPSVGTLIGPTGAGKTDALEMALKKIPQDKIRIIRAGVPAPGGSFKPGYIINPTLSALGGKRVHSMVGNQNLCVQLLYESETDLRVRVLYVVNEAHFAGAGYLHYLRWMMEWEYMGERGPFFSLLFIAQNCFRNHLRAVREVGRRVPPVVELPRLSAEETRRLLLLRCNESGRKDLFTAGAVKVLVDSGSGIPLDAIRFADLAARQAYTVGDSKVRQVHAETAIANDGGALNLADALRNSGFRRTSIIEYARKAGHRIDSATLSRLASDTYNLNNKEEKVKAIFATISRMKELAAAGELPANCYHKNAPLHKPDAEVPVARKGREAVA